MSRILRRRLEAAGSLLSPERALRTRREIQCHCVRIDGRPYDGVGRATAQQLKLFQHLAIPLPKHA